MRASLGSSAEEIGADPVVIASFLIAICDGFALQWLIDPETTPDGDQVVASLGAALLSALHHDQAPTLQRA